MLVITKNNNMLIDLGKVELLTIIWHQILYEIFQQEEQLSPRETRGYDTI